MSHVYQATKVACRQRTRIRKKTSRAPRRTFRIESTIGLCLCSSSVGAECHLVNQLPPDVILLVRKSEKLSHHVIDE